MGLIKNHLNFALMICNVIKTKMQKRSYLHVWGIVFLRQHFWNIIWITEQQGQFIFKHMLQYTYLKYCNSLSTNSPYLNQFIVGFFFLFYCLNL